MAIVYLARDIKHDREVALKVFRPELASSLGADRFLREIQIAAKLSHPHILPLYDSGEADGFLYYIMPLVEGESLADRMEREKMLPFDDALQLTREVADALNYAHARGLVHRDIKPDNIMLTGGHAVVMDFGIARAVSAAGGDKLTQTGMAVGTPLYMSPEQGMAVEEVDGRTDIYSLGCVLYEMLAGTPPFTGPTPQAVMARHTMDQVPSPAIIRETISPELEEIIFCSLAKSPADRFRTAAEFGEALKVMQTGTGTMPRFSTSMPRMSRAVTRETLTTPLPFSPRRMTKGRSLVAASVAALAVGAAVYQFGFRGPSGPSGVGGLDPSSIAVMYFEDFSPDGSLEHVAAGFTEGLISRLSRVPGLSVVSRNGVARYRGTDISRDSIGRALEAGSVVAGSVEQVGEMLRVTVRLADGLSGADLERPRTFDLPADQVLAVQDTLADNVVMFLRQRLGDEVTLRRRMGGTSDDAAWTMVQRAAQLRGDAFALEEDDPDQAERVYRQADSLAASASDADPQWAEPIVARGWLAYDLSYLADGREVVDRMETAVAHAERAIAVDDSYGDALHLRGRSRYRLWLLEATTDPEARDQLLEDARSDLEAAVDADPGLANAWYALSRLHYDRRDNMSAVIAARRAYEADAFLGNQSANLFTLWETNFDLEQFPDAQRWCDEGTRLFPTDPSFVRCQLRMMLSPSAEPNVDRAWRLFQALDTLQSESLREFAGHRARMVVGGVIARAGLADSARSVLVAARAGREVDPERQLALDEAVMRALLGDLDEAIDLMTDYVAVNPGHDFVLDRELHWFYRPLRDHPGFRQLTGSGR
jgi:serine/threonine-protein kinase